MTEYNQEWFEYDVSELLDDEGRLSILLPPGTFTDTDDIYLNLKGYPERVLNPDEAFDLKIKLRITNKNGVPIKLFDINDESLAIVNNLDLSQLDKIEKINLEKFLKHALNLETLDLSNFGTLSELSNADKLDMADLMKKLTTVKTTENTNIELLKAIRDDFGRYLQDYGEQEEYVVGDKKRLQDLVGSIDEEITTDFVKRIKGAERGIKKRQDHFLLTKPIKELLLISKHFGINSLTELSEMLYNY